ncbi:MAG: SDR family NAD(P)-dependent oxidoreductase [Ruminiclostridium sp.]
MLNAKVALVTGSSRGIGCVIARRMAEYNADVILTYHSSEEKAVEVKESIGKTGNKCSMVQMDVRDETSVKQAFEYIMKEYGKLDILVNNAGEGHPIPFEDMSINEWNDIVSLNLTGTFMCMKHSIPHLRKAGGGRIINISSVAALTGGAFGPGYAATKAGIIGLTKSAARELAKYGISANVVAPGPIESEMTDSLDKDVMNQIIDATPLKRLGRVQEVAELVCQLANPNIDYITGQTIVLDGGRYMI